MKAKAPSRFVNKVNSDLYDHLFWLKNTKGKKALSECHLSIVKYIGSFPANAGCYASNATMNEQTCRSSMKAFIWNLGYLLYIGAIRAEQTDAGRTYFLSMPKGPIIPQSVYRYNKGITSYSYVGSKVVFFDGNEGKAFPCSGKAFPVGKESFSPKEESFSHREEKRVDLKTEKSRTPPKAPPLEDGLASLDREAAARPQAKGCALREGGEDFFEELTEKGPSAMAKPKKKEDDIYGDPLETSSGKRKNAQERMAEAAILHNKGHIVNPLGKVDNRGRRLCPERARPIGEEGEPTIAELYAYLYHRFEDNGWNGVFEREVQPYRDHANARFGELKQKFMETCGCVAKNRTLYEYFKWFLEPSRIDIFMASAKKAGRDYPVWQQMCGIVYLRKFYESEMKSRKPSATLATGKRMEKLQAEQSYIEEAYGRLRKAQDSEIETMRCMREFGIVMYAQFLHDEREYDGSKAKQSIVNLVAHFLGGFPDKVKGRKFMTLLSEATRQNEDVGNDNGIWPQWRETVEDIVRTAMEQAGYNHPMEVPADADEEKRGPGQVDHPADEIKA